METLQDLAERRNTAILCTIHQPSSQLFAMFDQVLLLSEGRVAFFGDPEDAVDFFSSLGYKCPSNYNPADYLIGVLSTEYGQSDRSAQRISTRICDMFAVSDAASQRDLLVNLEMHMYESGAYRIEDEMSTFKAPFCHTTMYWLVWRFFISVIRDPTIQYLRLWQKIGNFTSDF